MKTLLPHLFIVCNVKLELQQLLEKVCVAILPKLTKDYYRIILIKILSKPITEKNFLEYYQHGITICEYLNVHDYVNGYIIVNDYRESNIFDLTTKINPVQFQQYVSIVTKGYGARIKGIHMVTKSKIVDVFMKILKPLCSQKIASRLHSHKTLEELYEIVPKNIFPIEYGGRERSFAELCESWIDELTSPESVEYIRMVKDARTDETLRQADKFNEEYMGMPGSFRNLSVD